MLMPVARTTTPHVINSIRAIDRSAALVRLPAETSLMLLSMRRQRVALTRPEDLLMTAAIGALALLCGAARDDARGVPRAAPAWFLGE